MYYHLTGEIGFPQIKYLQKIGTKSYMVMDLLGPSIEDLFLLCDRKFSLKTVLMLLFQMVERLEVLHAKGIVHRDQKPDNYCVGRGSKKFTIYLIDFGLSKFYVDIKGNHVEYTKRHKKGAGTMRYLAIPTHCGEEFCRRDDLESLMYIVIRCLKSKLPWEQL